METVDVQKRFAVALSFPGEVRNRVGPVAALLAQGLGAARILYDKFHEAEFARPNLDTHLQHLYRDETELIVVILCAAYERKEWCGLEWRAIRDLIKQRKDESIMLLNLGDAAVSGVFSIDGYVDISHHTDQRVADLILQRLSAYGRVPLPDLTPKSDAVVEQQRPRYDEPVLALALRRRAESPGSPTFLDIQPQATEISDDELEKTMSNPHYTSDLRAIEVDGYASLSMVGRGTIMVVVGTRVDAELFDRPVAETLRDVIDKRGFPDPMRRAIIVTDVEWYRNERLNGQPSISIGGPVANTLTKELDATVPPHGRWTIGLNRLHGAFIMNPIPRAALWGPFAHDTRRSVERYMEKPEGLAAFLELCWR